MSGSYRKMRLCGVQGLKPPCERWGRLRQRSYTHRCRHAGARSCNRGVHFDAPVVDEHVVHLEVRLLAGLVGVEANERVRQAVSCAPAACLRSALRPACDGSVRPMSDIRLRLNFVSLSPPSRARCCNSLAGLRRRQQPMHSCGERHRLHGTQAHHLLVEIWRHRIICCRHGMKNSRHEHARTTGPGQRLTTEMRIEALPRTQTEAVQKT